MLLTLPPLVVIQLCLVLPVVLTCVVTVSQWSVRKDRKALRQSLPLALGTGLGALPFFTLFVEDHSLLFPSLFGLLVFALFLSMGLRGKHEPEHGTETSRRK